jgi:hypothetical protein
MPTITWSIVILRCAPARVCARGLRSGYSIVKSGHYQPMLARTGTIRSFPFCTDRALVGRRD